MAQGLPPAKKPSERAKTLDQQIVKNLVPSALAILIATPIAYVAMQRWLENFAYRIEISWGLLLAAGLLAILVAWLTVSYQSIKAALTDPVKALRHE